MRHITVPSYRLEKASDDCRKVGLEIFDIDYLDIDYLDKHVFDI